LMRVPGGWRYGSVTLVRVGESIVATDSRVLKVASIR
jgi:hypothetical protein